MRFSLALALTLILSLIGCGKKEENPMVGTWKFEFAQKNVSVAEIKMDFQGDGTFVYTSSFQGKAHTANGTYKLEGKTLTLTSQIAEGAPTSGESKVVTLADDMKSFDPPGSASIGKMVKQPSK